MRCKDMEGRTFANGSTGLNRQGASCLREMKHAPDKSHETVQDADDVLGCQVWMFVIAKNTAFKLECERQEAPDTDGNARPVMDLSQVCVLGKWCALIMQRPLQKHGRSPAAGSPVGHVFELLLEGVTPVLAGVACKAVWQEGDGLGTCAVGILIIGLLVLLCGVVCSRCWHVGVVHFPPALVVHVFQFLVFLQTCAR